MDFSKTTTIGEIVAADYRTATLFSTLGIDFCCKGQETLENVCLAKQLDIDNIKSELTEIMSKNSDTSVDFKSWEIDLLADYIEKTHHRYTEDQSQAILPLLEKLCNVHGSNHPELFEVNQLFKESAQDLAAHMKKEELILFPFIRKMALAKRNGEELVQPRFGTIENPIAMMMHEHDGEGERFRKIAELTENYNPPADACTTYQTTLNMLNDFEKDLHKHIHLENNILFPKAINAQQELTGIIS